MKCKTNKIIGNYYSNFSDMVFGVTARRIYDFTLGNARINTPEMRTSIHRKINEASN